MLDAVRLTICIATYRRPHGLARLLAALDGLKLDASHPMTIGVIVADNDIDQSARKIVTARQHVSPWHIVYLHVQQRGIGNVRNAAVREARAHNAEYVAFIDDDEVPEADWMRSLFATMLEFNADVVTGPVLPYFEEPVPQWVIDGKIFERPRYATGRKLHSARTGNALVRMNIFNTVGYFNETLGLVNGEDTELFVRAVRCGALIVWGDSSIVHEWIPATKSRVRAILRRAVSVGYGWARSETDNHRAARGAAGAIAKGLLTLPTSLWRGRHVMITSMQLVATGAGYILAKSGVPFEAYRQTHGK